RAMQGRVALVGMIATAISFDAADIGMSWHAPPTVATTQSAAYKEIFQLPVTTTLLDIPLYLRLCCLEGRRVNDRWYGNGNPLIAWYVPPASLLVRVAFARQTLLFAIVESPDIRFIIENIPHTDDMPATHRMHTLCAFPTPFPWRGYAHLNEAHCNGMHRYALLHVPLKNVLHETGLLWGYNIMAAFPVVLDVAIA